MKTYIYLVEIYKYSNNYKEMIHYVLSAYKTREKAIQVIKDCIKISKKENCRIIKGNGDNYIGGIINNKTNESKFYKINEITLK